MHFSKILAVVVLDLAVSGASAYSSYDRDVEARSTYDNRVLRHADLDSTDFVYSRSADLEARAPRGVKIGGILDSKKMRASVKKSKRSQKARKIKAKKPPGLKTLNGGASSGTSTAYGSGGGGTSTAYQNKRSLYQEARLPRGLKIGGVLDSKKLREAVKKAKGSKKSRGSQKPKKIKAKKPPGLKTLNGGASSGTSTAYGNGGGGSSTAYQN